MRVLLITFLLLFTKLTLARVAHLQFEEIKLTFNDREYALSPDTERLEESTHSLKVKSFIIYISCPYVLNFSIDKMR